MIVVREGYKPGLIGWIFQMHALFYSRFVNFGEIFESQVAAGLAEFVPRLDRPGNARWHLDQNGEIVGSVAIDGEDRGDGEAHLRWFIIDESARGAGYGQILVGKAVTFCDDHDYDRIHLSTFKGLDAARRLYERHGFVLTSEASGNQWGSVVMEQTFVGARSRP